MLLCVTVYGPGVFSIPVIDRDEARFAQASRQMVESVLLAPDEQDPALHAGGLAVPMVGGKARLNKPPLVYYVQGASVALFTGLQETVGRVGSGSGGGGGVRGGVDDAIWMYRVPGVLCAMLSVILTWRLGLRLFDPRAALLGAALLAICPLMVMDAHMARADQLLLVTVLLTQTMLFDAWRRIEREGSIGLIQGALLWAGVGLGIMAKGPITPMVFALTAIALAFGAGSRRQGMVGGWKFLWKLRPVTGVVVVALLVGPWVFAVGERVGWDVYLRVVVDETLGRVGEAKEGHFGPPGYHTVLSAVLLWPGSLLTLAAFGRAWKRGGLWRGGLWRRGKAGPRCGFRDAERFLLAWIVPSWIVFELVLTKLPHYTMPMYPALALLSARGVLGLRSLPGLNGRGMKLGVRVWGVLGVVLAAGIVVVIARDMRTMPWYVWLVYVPLAMSAMVAFSAFHVERTRNGHVQLLYDGMRAMVTIAIVFFLFALPNARSLWNTERIMGEVRLIDPQGTRALASVWYHEDSLVFESRGRLARIGREEIDAWLDANPDGLVVMPSAWVAETPGVRALTAGWVGEGARGERPGYNYSNGRRVDLTIVERARER